MSKREPIEDLLAAGGVAVKRQQQLQQALQIRQFAVTELGLPDNDSYRSFVELDQDFIVWNVVAAPKYSLTPTRWCFPVVGCVSYRGYYAEQDAEAFAAQIDHEKFDVMVRGARAYSTLGWFADPLTSPMIDRGEILLAEVVFHELAHQIFYVKNDTSFNEAFASAVGEHGVRRWLAEKNVEALDRYERYLKRKAAFIGLLATTSEKLQALYASGKNESQMAEQKKSIFTQLKLDYKTLKSTQWEGYNGYDGWFKKPVNNARLASVAVYQDKTPDFSRWLSACGFDFQQFYQAMIAISELPEHERHQRLAGSANCQSESIKFAIRAQ